MLVHFLNIEWDTDGEDLSFLPESVTLTVNDDVNVKEVGADILSDKYGFCVNSFNFEEEDL